VGTTASKTTYNTHKKDARLKK